MTRLAIKLFGYDNAQTILTRTYNGKHWYMARDICRLLGISNYSTAVHKKHRLVSCTLEKSEWRKEVEFTGTSRRELLLVNDSGMLKLIMKSNSSINCEIQERARQLFSGR